MQVTGDSMMPGFRAGDRLLLGPPWWTRPGQVVAVIDPREPGRLLVKRVHAINRSVIEVRGDNGAASTDSRQFGPLPRSSLAGRVIYRYAPAERVGWLPGRATRPGGSTPSGSRHAVPPNPRR